jgi:WD40 repeat protein
MIDRVCLLLLAVVIGFALLPWVSTGPEEIGYSRLISTIPARIKSLERMTPSGNPYFLDNSHIGSGDSATALIYNIETGELYNANEVDRAKLTALRQNPLRPKYMPPIRSEHESMGYRPGYLGYLHLPIPGSTLESPNHQFRLIAKEGDRNMCYLIATGSGKVLLQLPGETEIESSQFSPDSQRLAHSDRSGTLYVWNLASLSR